MFVLRHIATRSSRANFTCGAGLDNVFINDFFFYSPLRAINLERIPTLNRGWVVIQRKGGAVEEGSTEDRDQTMTEQRLEVVTVTVTEAGVLLDE